MSRDYQTYDFRSVGILEDEFNTTTDSQEKTNPPIGIKTPIQMASRVGTVFEMHNTLILSIRDNLKNLIATNHGERLMLPSFGANLRDLLFDIGTEAGDTRIMQQIATAVSRHMPFVELAGFTPVKKISSDGNISKIAVRVSFDVPSLNEKNIGIEVILYEGG